MTKYKRRTPIMLGIAAMTLAACGSGSTSAKVSTGPTAPPPPSKTAASTTIPSTTLPSIGSSEISTTTSLAPQKSPLPSVQVLDTANGQTVQFASLLPAVKPVLFWFWAPH